jgi:glycosyltransferase involved in cell wall biosynthesis
MNNLNRLTAVIPFHNEGDEIEKTVANIRQTAGYDIDIVLVNDASTDEFDYLAVAERYNAAYFHNQERLGVAGSRTLGAAQVSTPFLILLDGHVRFYSNEWHRKVVAKLEDNDRAVYCFKCLVLDADGKAMNDRFGTGGSLRLTNEPEGTLLNPDWIISAQTEMFEIPCVYGASYSISKRYWDYLKGLTGLRYYGMDETLLSLKVWLEGGSCFVLPDVEMGHIFRTQAPYFIASTDIVYNKLLITETLLPDDFALFVHAALKANNRNDYLLALALINRNKEQILSLKEYCNSIMTRDFEFIKQLNARFSKTEKRYFSSTDTDAKLNEIAAILANEPSLPNGLMAGKVGEAIFLAEFAHYNKMVDYDKLIDKTVRLVMEDIADNRENLYNLATGLAGKGLGLMYLKNKGFTDIDLENTLEDIDDKLFTFAADALAQHNYGLIAGATGAAAYFLKRKKQYHINFVLREIENAAEIISNLPPDMSTGIQGLLLFLIAAHSQSSNKDIIVALVRQFADRLTSQAEKTAVNGLGWDIGQLGTGFTLLRTAQLLNDLKLNELAARLLHNAASRRNPVSERLYDASFFNGSSGTAYLFHKLFRLTGENDFAEARDFWKEETLFKAIVGREYAGYLSAESQLPVNNRGILGGIAGIGLTLLSIETDNLLLDDFFLLT